MKKIAPLIILIFFLLSMLRCSSNKDSNIPVDDVEQTEEEDIENDESGDSENDDSRDDDAQQGEEETDTNSGLQVNLVTDYGANNTDNEDDSQNLRNAIDFVTNQADGGTVFIPKGKYYFIDVDVKSNITLLFEEGATIFPTEGAENSKRLIMFNFGLEAPVAENVVLKAMQGRFIIDLRSARSSEIIPFRLRNIDNFEISDFDILDNFTKFSSITMGMTLYDGNYYAPRNGIVKNASTFDSDYGYGLVQVQAAKNITFTDLYGKGGLTLRLESGEKNMNDLQPMGINIDMVTGENIASEDGNGAAMISPHSMKNGKVEMRNISAVNSGFALRIEDGFVAAKQENPNLEPGTFSEVLIQNVTATYGTSAQLKWKHWSKYMPCELRTMVTPKLEDIPEGSSIGKTIFTGPSISPVLNSAFGEGPGRYSSSIDNVNAMNFNELGAEKNILTTADIVNNCDS